ncbi:SPOR domain-containing protein [Marinilabiliaceae bacterium JC017]|nr:SPOR domain-containing protein [Marinilabiliaceae bacterium JC017]
MLRKLLLVVIILGGFCGVNQGQEKTYTSKEAYGAFSQGDYQQALEMYGYLIAKYEREPKYNYYYGICLLENNLDLSQALKRIKYAAIKGVKRDVYFYLGRAYQLNYEFGEAIKNYNRFLRYATSADDRRVKAEQFIKECEVGAELATKIYYLRVIAKDTATKSDLLKYYHPGKDVGQISRNKDFFESGVDPEGIMYMTERGDEIYFSLADQDSTMNLFKMENLIDGWSESVELEGLNSQSDDCFPFLQIDGTTIYFASNRPGGLGGYDIYKSSYDSESKSFTEPVNMGIPFNSPKDDYLFASDEFQGVAWFVSNRYTQDDQVMVYQIIWDNSVVKNMVYEAKDVKIAATMPLSEDVPEKQKEAQKKQKVSDRTAKSDELFVFMVADTLKYTDFFHFRSEAARRSFKRGYNMQIQKDSLSQLMHDKRIQYARTNSDEQRNSLVNDILRLEKEVYGLDAQISNYFDNARQTEQNKIKELIKGGQYQPIKDVQVEASDDLGAENILIPDDYEYYTDEEFAIKLARLDSIYQPLFGEDQVRALKHADSLFVWGNILTLEASRLLEQSSKVSEVKELVISSPFKQKQDESSGGETQQLVHKSRSLKATAVKLYHMSLDRKYNIYRYKIKDLMMANPTIDLARIEELQAEANAYYRKAGEYENKIDFSMEEYEKAGSFKREAIALQEEALFSYIKMDFTDQKHSINKVEPKGKVQKSYQELHKGDEAVKNSRATGVVSTVKSNENLRSGQEDVKYKVQIGVFKNEPSKEAIMKIPPISSESIPGKGLTKYFAGEYSSLEEAKADVEKIRQAGFSGAFVVAFYKGERISLAKAAELKK